MVATGWQVRVEPQQKLAASQCDAARLERARARRVEVDTVPGSPVP
jgi:hypothetical protein